MKSKKFVWTVYKPPLKEEFSRWRKLNKKGYIDTKDKNGKSITEHRLVMEKYIGRKLKKGEIVHHIDHDRSNNNIENLILCNSSFEHSIVDDVLTDTPGYIKYKITKNRTLEWEILHMKGGDNGR